MFAMTRKPRGLFGSGQLALPGPISGFGGGTFNVDGTQATPVDRHAYAQTNEAPQRKAGFFGQGGVGRAIAGTIGDVLLQRGGMAPIYAPTMAFQQRQALEQQQAERERQAKRNDWVFQQQWEREHPKPANNDTVADYEFIRQTLGDEEAKKFLKNKASPIMWRQGPDGQFYPMAPPSGGDAPDTLPADFDFGDGGGAPSGTGTFPR